MSAISLAQLCNSLDRFSTPLCRGNSLVNGSRFDAIRFRYGRQLNRERELAILTIAADTLKNTSRLSPKEVFKGREAYILREWFRRTSVLKEFESLSTEQKKAAEWAPLLQFKTELTAYRLGITAENLNASEGLETFSEKKAFLPNYLSFYNHELPCDTPQSPVKVMMNGEYVDWAVAKSAIIDQDDIPSVQFKASKIETQWPWKYGPKGLQNQDLFVWDEADMENRTFTREKYATIGKYLFSICVFHSAKGPRMSGDHSWIRLITPEGKIYEFGKYRPPGIKGRMTALVKHDALIQSPDCSTMWPIPPKEKRRGENPPLRHTDHTVRTKISFEISEEQFHRAKDKVLELQRAQNLQFGLFGESCMVFVNQVANICGIRLKTEASIMKLILPPKLIPLVDRIAKLLPKLLFDILYYIPGLCTNVFCLFLGAGVRSKVDGTRHIGNLWDFLNPYKSMLHHPWYVASLLKAEIDRSRPEGSFEIPAQFAVDNASRR